MSWGDFVSWERMRPAVRQFWQSAHPGRHPVRFAAILAVTTSLVISVQFAISDGEFQWSSVPIAVAFAVVSALTYLLFTIPSDRWRDVMFENLGYLSLAVLTVGTFYFGWYAAGHAINGNFFATVAQVLPVLLLAALLDTRQRRPLHDHQVVLYVFSVAWGEFASLTALAFDKTTDKLSLRRLVRGRAGSVLWSDRLRIHPARGLRRGCPPSRHDMTCFAKGIRSRTRPVCRSGPRSGRRGWRSRSPAACGSRC
jgi:hypothetical protein